MLLRNTALNDWFTNLRQAKWFLLAELKTVFLTCTIRNEKRIRLMRHSRSYIIADITNKTYSKMIIKLYNDAKDSRRGKTQKVHNQNRFCIWIFLPELIKNIYLSWLLSERWSNSTLEAFFPSCLDGCVEQICNIQRDRIQIYIYKDLTGNLQILWRRDSGLENGI